MNPQLVKTLTTTQQKIAKVEAKVMEATAALQQELTTLRAKDAEVRTAIKEAMIKNSVKKFESDTLTITLVAASERKTLDTAAIKEEEPDVYERYLKFTPVAASVRIKAK